MATIEFWFDYISPYAYLAWQRIHAVAERAGREVVYRPVLLAGLLNHWGQLGPAEVEPKRTYMFRHVSRRARALGVPMLPPPSHPFNPLLALRLSCLDMEPGEKRRLIELLFRGTWGGGPGIASDMAVRLQMANADFDTAALIVDATTTRGKTRLHKNGEEAIERGIFGVPTMIADGELFWGEDSIDDLETFLRGEDELDQRLIKRWSETPASSKRR